MRAILNLPPSVRLIEAGLEGLVQINRVLIETRVVPSSPLDSSVVYKRERSGLEEWDNALACMKRGWGDCEDLNSWECARINIEEDEWARCALIQTGKRMFHCVIRMSDGGTVDICPDLGMKVPGTALEGIPWVETREENIIGARRKRQTTAARIQRGVWGRSQHPNSPLYKPKPSNRTQSTTPYRPKSSRSDRGGRDPMMEPDTEAPGTKSATQMVSPTSAQNPGMDNMPMPMMEPDEEGEGLDESLAEPEAFDQELIDDEGTGEE